MLWGGGLEFLVLKLKNLLAVIDFGHSEADELFHRD
jgi:hypothetical protein